MNNLPKFVRIVEVGPRDGLQNEKKVIPLQVKLNMIRKLEAAGLRSIEAGSFVSSKWVPQMAGTEDIFKALNASPNKSKATFSALTPNTKGVEAAIAVGVKEIAVFAAATESFSQTNINCSIEESIRRFEDATKLALRNNIKVRGYVSCVLGCPYEGMNVAPEKVLEVSQRLLDLGCYEISLGDTIGVGTPGSTSKLLETIVPKISADKIAVHFHDTYGQALPNILAALQHGISVVDSSVSGLGGCPYAAGASGNVATEDVVYMLNGMNIETGVSLDGLFDAANYIDGFLGDRISGSKYTRARLGHQAIEAKKAAANANQTTISKPVTESIIINTASVESVPTSSPILSSIRQ